MTAPRKGNPGTLSAEQQIQRLIARFEPKRRLLIRSVRSALRRRFPSVDELVYDYPGSLVIAYSPTERGSDAVVAISAGADGLRLIFNQGPTLPDPRNILLGSGKQTRFIWIESRKTLSAPEVNALLEAAAERSKTPLPSSGRGTTIVKPKSAKQRASRKPRR